jgi:glutamate-ammonia-ligase adenylyltransferase
VSVDSFAEYQRESAWTWEHMALARARTVFGSDEARAAVDAIIGETLRRPRDPATLVADAARMRGDVARHKPPAGPFDVKLIDGGLVDAEFCIHVVQLRDGIGLDPGLEAAATALIDAGRLAPGFLEAARLLTRMLVVLRLIAPAGAEPEAVSRPLVAQACGATSWEALLTAYADARRLVAGEWRRIVAMG